MTIIFLFLSLVIFFVLFYVKKNGLDRVLETSRPRPRKRPWSDIENIFDGKEEVLVKSRKCSYENKVLCDTRDKTSCIDCAGGNFLCKHFDKDIKIYEGNNETANFYKANKSLYEGYCINIVGSQNKFCNPKTGRLVLARVSLAREGYFFLCQCLYPNIYTKKNLDSDCDVPVRCKIKNMSSIDNILTHGICECTKNFKSVNMGFDGPRCMKKKLREDPDITERPGFVLANPFFYDSNFDVKFRHKHPCQWDMMRPDVHLPSNHIMYKYKNAFCFCDPDRGNFPVYPEDSFLSIKDHKRFPAGCSNIYAKGEGSSHKFSEIVKYYETVEPEVIWNFETSAGKKILVKVKWPYSISNILKFSKIEQPLSIYCYGIPAVGAVAFLREYICKTQNNIQYAPSTCDQLSKKDFKPYHILFNRVINRDYMVQFLRAYNQVLCRINNPTKHDKEDDVTKYDFLHDTLVLNPLLMNPTRNKDNSISGGLAGALQTSIEGDLSNVLEFTVKNNILNFRPYTKKTLKDARSKCKGVPMNQCSS